MSEIINKISEKFSPISLQEMDGVSLLKRTDTKFIIPQSMLPHILSGILSSYRLLEINGRRRMNYKSLYFDTPEKKFYLDHHNGKLRRTKIRIREYVDSNLFFFEIKLKDGKGNTNKLRCPISKFEQSIPSFYANFVKESTGINYDLRPTLWNNFQRMTFVNTQGKERVTVDLNLSYSFLDDEKKIANLVIIELKQERYNRNSILVRALKEYSIVPYGFSKYCIGMTQLYSDIKYNAFKPKLLRLKKITA